MLRDLFKFLVLPKINEQPESLPVLEMVYVILKIAMIYVVWLLVSTFLIFPILKSLNLVPKPSLPISHIPLSFKLIIFVPFYEEAIFRLPLKYSKQNLFGSLAALQFLLFYHIFNIIVLVCISVAIALIPYYRLISETLSEKIGSFWFRNFPILFYGLAVCFGFMHLSNFDNLNFGHYLVFPLIVSNQIIMGLLFGYVRVTYKNGFFYSVLLHFIINLPIILISH